MTISPVGAGTALIGSFEHKRIDGFAFSSPASDIAINQFGGVMLVNFAKGEYVPLRGFLYLSLISRNDWLQKDPQRAAKVVRAFSRAQKLINEKPDEAKAAMRTFFPRMDEASFNMGFTANAAAIPAEVKIDKAAIIMNKEFVEAVEEIKLDVDIDKVFTNEYVDLAKSLK
jgi:NitT/TauT family transport system substrate-binding protein